MPRTGKKTGDRWKSRRFVRFHKSLDKKTFKKNYAFTGKHPYRKRQQAIRQRKKG